MEEYIVSARKYRPTTFQSVVGQHALTQTLKNAIAGNKLAHAYLFSGPRGVGKTTCARIFAKTINCLHPTPDHEACNECESCVAFNEQRSYNIHELDAASNNGVDDMRSLIDQVRIPPQISKYKVYIIDEVHMLSTSAFNSFLKTLEEPPAHAIFVLATTEKHKIIPTILSRCQVYDFSRITIADTVHHLEYVAKNENVQTEVEALNIIAQKADGGMRDALSIFDQIVSFTNGNVTYKAVIENLNVLDYEYYFKLTEAILDGNVVDCLLILNDIYNRGFEGQFILNGISSHFRDLMVCKDPNTVQLFQVGASIRERYVEMAKRCTNSFLYQAMDIANTCDLNYRMSKNKRLMVELTMIRLCQLSEGAPLSAPTDDKKSIAPINVTPASHPSPETETKPVVNTNPPAVSTSETAKNAPTVESAEKKVEVERNSQPATPAPQPTRPKAVSLSDYGVSLSSLTAQKQEQSVQKTETVSEEKLAERFTEQELIEAWKSYADTLTEEVLLKKTMGLYLPKILSDSVLEVEVNTEINKNYLQDNSVSIMDFLRRKLRNDNLTMTFRISEANMIEKPLTPREIFEDMAQKNPALISLSKQLDLELE